jgi:hypothetical protein
MHFSIALMHVDEDGDRVRDCDALDEDLRVGLDAWTCGKRVNNERAVWWDGTT